jgi:NAD/NADP transhydrogenase beta subunit
MAIIASSGSILAMVMRHKSSMFEVSIGTLEGAAAAAVENVEEEDAEEEDAEEEDIPLHKISSTCMASVSLRST